MSDRPLNSVEAEGVRYLSRDARLGCRPRAATGESNAAFINRMARHYGIPREEAAEILGIQG